MARPKISTGAVTGLAASGAGDATIGAALGCHRDTARRRRTAAAAPSGREVAQQARLARVRELHAKGLSDGEIARQTGRTAAAAAAKDRATLNLPANYRGPRRVGAPVQ